MENNSSNNQGQKNNNDKRLKRLQIMPVIAFVCSITPAFIFLLMVVGILGRGTILEQLPVVGNIFGLGMQFSAVRLGQISSWFCLLGIGLGIASLADGVKSVSQRGYRLAMAAVVLPLVYVGGAIVFVLLISAIMRL